MLLTALFEKFFNNAPRPQTSDERRYHADIGFPDDVKFPDGFSWIFEPRYSNHARAAAEDDRYGKVYLPHRVDLRKGKTIEIGVTGRVITTIVHRFPYDDKLDLVMAIMPDNNFVKTVWFNEKNDTHGSLNRSRYADPRREKRAA